jgi:hypothetical protein
MQRWPQCQVWYRRCCSLRTCANLAALQTCTFSSAPQVPRRFSLPLGQRSAHFLVEYCGQRARPNVAESPYLLTLGRELSRDVGVFWTGPAILSENITGADLDQVAKILQRPPVIWDNLHANDYDQRRLYLGPYSGELLSPFASGSPVLMLILERRSPR